MQSNPESKFIDRFAYKTVVTDVQQVVGTENKEEFTKNYLNDTIRGEYKLIGTHSEAFHCDEVLACSILLRTDKFKKSIIVRTRDQDMLDQLDIQCDVGGVFDVEKCRFDHHQKTFEHTWWTDDEKAREAAKQAAIAKGEEPPVEKEYKPAVTKLSSAGLIYKYFGKEIIQNTCKLEYNIELSEKELEHVYQKLYSSFFKEIDAHDNGVNIAEDQKYYISTHLSARVSYFNTPWNAPAEAGYSQHIQFKKAMKMAEQDFFSQLYGIVMVMMPARRIVEQAWEERFNFHKSGEFMWFENPCPWKEHLLDIEKENDMAGHIKFSFYQDGRKMFRVQALPATVGKFNNRISLAKEMRGLRGEELQKVAGVPDAEFVHAAGFIGGAWSKDSVLKMAVTSVERHNEEQAAISLEQDLQKKQKVE